MVDADFAGLPWRMTSRDPSVRAHLEHLLAPFRPDSALRDAIEVHVGRTDVGGARSADVAVHGEGDRVCAWRADFRVELDLTRRRATIRYGGAVPSLLSALRAATGFFLEREGGVLVHAAALASAGAGFVFAGPSGAGKTTIARLAQGRSVLSDEVAAVVLGAGGMRCFSSPFWGDFEGPRAALGAVPVARILFPQHAGEVALEPLSAARAALRLVPCIFRIGQSPARDRRLADICLSIVRTVRCDVLRFRPDASFWRAIHA